MPLALLWWGVIRGAAVSPWIPWLLVPLLALFHIRIFSLLHDCGHGSLCRSRWLNRSAGFLCGVLSGMPQYVWSRHHDFPHRTNGDWERYRGPLGTLSTAEYAALGASGQRRYRRMRQFALAPLGGFAYLLLNPRLNWLRGRWNTPAEGWHMTANNLVLLGALAWACLAFGTWPVLPVFIVSLSLAGAAGITLFTVQHNFEHAYASDTRGWNAEEGVLHGTSFLVLPRWLNWFTADIGYHHVHHLSAAIPNYRLARCHAENAALFTEVRRLHLRDVPASLRCLLWDREARRIISFAEYEQAGAAGANAGPGAL